MTKEAFIQSIHEEIKQCGLKSRAEKTVALPNMIRSIYAHLQATGNVSDWQKVRLDDAIDYCQTGLVDVSLRCLKLLCEEPPGLPFWYSDKLKKEAALVDLRAAIQQLP